MSLPALTQTSAQTPVQTSGRADGLSRSAALMRALGSRASAVWATLSPQEAERLSAAMAALPDDAASEGAAARAYVRGMSETTGPAAGQPVTDPAPGLWQSLSESDAATIASLVTNESPQIIAVILSRLSPQSAAATVRALPMTLASEALLRLLHLGDIRPVALAVIETTLARTLATRVAAASAGHSANSGHERVARIFDSLDSRTEQGLMTALDGAEPGLGAHIRTLMFTFDDLAKLGPASIQTILAGTDRAALILALKGAKPETANVFFANMTGRAGDLLRSEIETTGPVRRSEIDSARSEISAFARTLVNRGDILTRDENDDELIE